MGHRGKYVCLIENSLTSSSHKQLLQQQNKTSDRPHGLRTWFMADWGRWGGSEGSRAHNKAWGHRGPYEGRIVGVRVGRGRLWGPGTLSLSFSRWALAALTVVVNFRDQWRHSHENFRGELHCCGGEFQMSLPFTGHRTLFGAFVSNFLRVLGIRCGYTLRGFCLNFKSTNCFILTCRHIHVVQTPRLT